MVTGGYLLLFLFTGGSSRAFDGALYFCLPLFLIWGGGLIQRHFGYSGGSTTYAVCEEACVIGGWWLLVFPVLKGAIMASCGGDFFDMVPDLPLVTLGW
ncbi:hypothetical protein GX586_03145 [bacterium]|nr:hypothetical protein [bacterium]